MFKLEAPAATAATPSAAPGKPQVAPPRPAFAPAPPSALHYAPSPIQRRSAPVNGITAAENAAVRQLSGGRVDLHGIGASLQRVPAGDRRLTAVGARSYARGRHALVGSDADRGHELWHLAQQAMGRVRGTARVGGQPVNDDPALEREAERQGARIEGYRPASAEAAEPGWAARVAGSETGPIQRMEVTAFNPSTDSLPPPASDLRDSLDRSYFTETNSQINSAISDKLYDPRKKNIPAPTEIEATIVNNGAKNSLARNSNYSGVIGKCGMDEFFLRVNGQRETFEGGHLIPHEVWSADDSDSEYADGYENLVPMSRNMNVNQEYLKSYRAIEKNILEYCSNLSVGGSLKVRVEIERDPNAYQLTYQQIANMFNLNIDGSKNGSDTVDLYAWLPSNINATGNPTSKKKVDLGMAVESALHDVNTPITTKSEFIDALMQTPLWSRMDEAMQKKVQAL